ncbi:MAG: thioredoxin family protein [Pseudomonadota bacterium]
MSLTRPPVCAFGTPAPHFMLPDTDGQIYALEECRGPKGTLVMFICNHCPYVVAVAEKLVREADALRDIGVSTVAICSNDAEAYPADAPERMGEFARRHRFPFPYLHDASQKVAKAYGAVCTPDFFGYDAALGLQYRGRLDDGTPGREGDGRRELFEAMRRVAETGRGPEDQTPSMGCSIKWRRAA